MPAWLDAFVIVDDIFVLSSPAPGWTRVHVDKPIGDYIEMGKLLAIGLVAPIAAFVVSSRYAMAFKESQGPSEIDDSGQRKRFAAILILFVVHLSLTVAIFEGSVRGYNAYLDAIPKGGGVPTLLWPLELAFKARNWVGFPLVYFGGRLFNTDFSPDPIHSPIFWFFAIGNSFVVATFVFAIFNRVKTKYLKSRSGLGPS